MTPAVQFGRFITGAVLGAGVGIFYGFLRPVRRKLPWFADLIFAAAAIWVYLFYGFAVCRGDLRVAYWAAGIAGALLWDNLPGRWLQPVFDGFWRFIGIFLRPLGKFFQKIGGFTKKILATAKKWGTIKWRKSLHKPPQHKGEHHERENMDFL